MRSPEELEELKKIRGADYEPEDGEDAPGIGHNGPPRVPEQTFNNAAAEKLRQVAQGIVSLEGEVSEAKDRVKEALSEAKSMGYDLPTLKWAIKELKLDPKEREMRDALRDTYMDTLGDLEFYS